MQEPHKLHAITERLGTDPLGRLLWRLSLPSIISIVSISLYNIVDTFWVARLGYQSVAALTAVMPFWVIYYAVGTGTGVGANAISSRRFGEGDPEAANRVAGQVVSLAVGLGLIFALATTFFTVPIIKLCGVTPDVIDIARQFLVVLGWGAPFLFLQLIARNMFQASGDAIRPMVFTIFGQVCNAVLDPFLIFGWGFFPAMGVAGAALSSVIASGLGTALAVYFVLAGKTPYRLRLKHLVPRWADIAAIYKVGLPAMMMMVNESISFALLNHVLSRYGSVALAAMGICGRLSDLLAFTVISGLANGLLPIVGFSFGAKLWRRLWGAVRMAIIWSVILMVAATLIYEVFAPQIVGLFSKDPELVKIAVPGMRIFLSSLIVVGPMFLAITTFQGLSKGTTAMVLSLGRQFLFFLPGLYALSAVMGMTGVWLSLPVSDILGVLSIGGWLLREYIMQRRSGLWDKAAQAQDVPAS